MESILQTPCHFIQSDKDLDAALAKWEKTDCLAVDTESNSLYAYAEQVCLIQFSTKSEDFLVDTLARMDVRRMAPIFSNPKIEKIFHAAEYDVLCLRRDFDFVFENIFDTMQSARILGERKCGLSNVLQEKLRVDTGKSFQKANWGKRPLPQNMRVYARMDTHFLIPMRDYFRADLKKKRLLPLAQEDFNRVANAENNKPHEPLYTQVSGFHLLSPKQLAILQSLCLFRDAEAKKKNRPLFKVISSRALYAIALTSPRDSKALREIGALPDRLRERYRRQLLQAVQNGLRADPIYLPAKKKPSQNTIKRWDALKLWRKKAAAKMGVQSDVVLPRDILEEIVKQNPHNAVALEQVMAQVPWRFQHFGGEIMNVLAKRNLG